jgi:hypothetical protein
VGSDWDTETPPAIASLPPWRNFTVSGPVGNGAFAVRLKLVAVEVLNREPIALNPISFTFLIATAAVSTGPPLEVASAFTVTVKVVGSVGAVYEAGNSIGSV